MRVAARTALVALAFVAVLFAVSYWVGSEGDGEEAASPPIPAARVPEIRGLGAVKPLPKLAASLPKPSLAAPAVVEVPQAQGAPQTGTATETAKPPARPVAPAPTPEPEPEPAPPATTPVLPAPGGGRDEPG